MLFRPNGIWMAEGIGNGEWGIHQMIILFDKTEITEFQAKKCTYKIVRFGL